MKLCIRYLAVISVNIKNKLIKSLQDDDICNTFGNSCLYGIHRSPLVFLTVGWESSLSVQKYCVNSLTNKPTDQPHIEAAEVIDGS